MDVDNVKVDLEKLKEDLALATGREQQDGEQHYQDIQDIWVRWEEIIASRNVISLFVFISGSRNW